MRRLVLTYALLLVTAGCRSKQTSDAGGVSDTSSMAAPAPEAEPAAATAPREFSFDERQQYTESIRQQLATADQQIEDLAAQVKSKGGAVSDRAVAGIRATRKTVDRSLRRVDAATAADWEQVKRGVSQSVERLNESIEAAQPK